VLEGGLMMGAEYVPPARSGEPRVRDVEAHDTHLTVQ
jgi:hypothetical protein